MCGGPTGAKVPPRWRRPHKRLPTLLAGERKYCHGGYERHDEPKSEMLRDTQGTADAKCRVGPRNVDEPGEEDLFDEEQNAEDGGARGQSKFASRVLVNCR